MQTRTTSRNGQARLHRDGFTLVEIMIVVAIVALLASIAIPNFIRARKNAKVAACINNLRVIDTAIQELKLERPGTALTEANISPFIGRGNGGTMPQCPAGGTYGDFDTEVSCTIQEPGYEHTLPH